MPKPKKRPSHEIAAKIASKVRRTSRAARNSQLAREYRATFDMLQSHANQLSEHFSSVQIAATKVNPNGSTSDFAAGSGDLHARVHLADWWVRKMEMMYGEGM